MADGGWGRGRGRGVRCPPLTHTPSGLVSGMMTYIVIQELLPTAHRYDPHDKVTTKSVIAGMAVMALSLVLFGL